MDGFRLQAILYRGYAAAARVSGMPYQQYRPATATSVIEPANLLQSLVFAPSVDNFAFGKASTYGKPERQVMVDGSQVKLFDYLIGPEGTFFVSALEALVPISGVYCNRVVSFLQPPSTGRGGGLQPYGGSTEATETPTMTGWPASVINGTKGEKGVVDLPDDVRQPWVAVLVPSFPGVQIQTDDVMTTDLGDRYKVSSAELTARGWRLTAMLAEA